MCYRKRCFLCNKLTYGGCGKHKEQVLEGVPQDQRCSCQQQVEEDMEEINLDE